MKKALLLSTMIMLVALLVGSTVGCGSNGTSRLIPTPTPTPTPSPTPSPTPQYGTHSFAFLRNDFTEGSAATQKSREELQAARRQAKIDHALLREAAATTEPDTANIYVFPFLYQDGWYPGKERKITSSSGPYTAVHLSLNDTDVVYTMVVNGYTQIFTNTVPSDGLMTTAPLQLTGDAEHHWLPHISDDGTKVIFTKFDAGSTGDVVCVIANSAGASEKCLDFSTTTPVLKGTNLWHAAWAPHGKIVFEAWAGSLTSDEIFMANEDGSGLIQVTKNAGTKNYDECPTVYPEGTGLAVATWRDDAQNYEINELDPNTNLRYTISSGLGGDAWDPLYTYYTLVWVGQSNNDANPQLYLDYVFDVGHLTNNAYANYFASSQR